MPTARDFVTLALKEAGVLGVGQTPLAEDINDGFTYLQRMIAQWQRNRWLVPALNTIGMPGNNLKSNTIGDGAYYNTPRPDKIQSAYVIQQNTGPNKVSLPLYPIFSRENYDQIAVKDLNTLPTYFFYDAMFPLGNIYFWPIPSAMYVMYLTFKAYIGFSTGIGAGRIVTAGLGYTDGNYAGIPFTNLDTINANGYGATADVTVAGGVITNIAVAAPGNGYIVGNKVSLDTTNMGGTGVGFIYEIIQTNASLDNIFNLPPEYEEAIHFNLALRLCSAYQRPVLPSTAMLAKTSLNTIRKANIQVPTMTMPEALTNGRAFNIWNPDGY